MNIHQLAEDIHNTAQEKGWWEDERPTERIFALIMTELAEAIEADREGQTANIKKFELSQETQSHTFKAAFEKYIKDTVGDELADAYIRTLDFLYYRDGDKFYQHNVPLDWTQKDFAQDVFYIMCIVADQSPEELLQYIETFCKAYQIDLQWHVEKKMAFNGMREYKHGNKKY